MYTFRWLLKFALNMHGLSSKKYIKESNNVHVLACLRLGGLEGDKGNLEVLTEHNKVQGVLFG